MRLDRFLAESTGMSRKEATKALHRGDVTLNGEVVKKGVVQVDTASEVMFNGATLKLQGPTYMMMHKPLDCVCSNDDPHHLTIFAYLDVPNPDKLHTVGRLDVDTTGLLLITNDGQWSHRITSPKRKCPKVYRAELADPLQPENVNAFAQGIKLRGEVELTQPAKLEIISEREALVTLHEGRYHQVRRMFAAVGNKVVALHREQVGALQLDPSLAPGEARELTVEEIALF
ncbi:16S rRNA pseudouridine(516) synthase RsuA [Aliidiomarina celeris]|uniref:16S rRNA pseudouridine(516) synthase RsuA n=1 Tax=Aliidiomarina celeris TaxID=2249428 RepID=UPI000DEB4385|nr:16S rRNA pseudouridine(516) synthase RsuA [Aliidiomarina celeris]